jgi:hypothetical protein
MCAVLVVAALLSAAPLAARQGDYTTVDLYALSGFGYVWPKAADIKAGKPFKSSIPPSIKALDGKKVRIDGFMIPYDQSSARVHEFMLVGSYDSCGFGDLPTGMNDWVHVSVAKGKPVAYTVNPIVVSGVLHVGEEFDKEGFVTSIYRLDADGVH